MYWQLWEHVIRPQPTIEGFNSNFFSPPSEGLGGKTKKEGQKIIIFVRLKKYVNTSLSVL